MLCTPEDILGFSPIQENKRSVQLMKIKECCTVESQECIARFLAHATETRSAFPFYMNNAQKELFQDRMYEALKTKISREQFNLDVKLATLNEYIEFVEAEEDEDGWYLEHAQALAEELLNL